MTNVEALKELYIKLGGQSEDVAEITSTAEMIDKVTEVAGSGTVEDYVVEIVNDGEGNYSTSVTPTQYAEAVSAGKRMVAQIGDNKTAVPFFISADNMPCAVCAVDDDWKACYLELNNDGETFNVIIHKIAYMDEVPIGNASIEGKSPIANRQGGWDYMQILPTSEDYDHNRLSTGAQLFFDGSDHKWYGRNPLDFFVIALTNSGGTWTSNKTTAEIVTAFRTGVKVVVSVDIQGTGTPVYLEATAIWIQLLDYAPIMVETAILTDPTTKVGMQFVGDLQNDPQEWTLVTFTGA